MGPNPSTLSYEYLHETSGPNANVIIITCFALAVVAVPLRLAARKAIKTPLWWDDYLIILALITAVGPVTLTLYLGHHTGGKHAQALSVASVLDFFKCLFVFEILYPLPIAATKFSILFYYRRIFKVQEFKLPFYIIAALIGCWLFYSEMVAIFTCVPTKAMWDPFVKGRCINFHKYFIGNAVPNIVADIALLVVPLPYMWKLQVALPRKVAVMVVFIFGGFVCVVSVIRVTFLRSLSINDVTYTFTPAGTWTIVEVTIGIVTASLPAFWPLLRAMTTGHLHASNTRKTIDRATGSNPTLGSHTQSKVLLSRRNNLDNEEGFMHLDDITTGESSPSSICGGKEDVQAEERERGPQVSVKPE